MSQTKTRISSRKPGKKAAPAKNVGKPIKIPGGATIYTPEQYIKKYKMGPRKPGEPKTSGELMIEKLSGTWPKEFLDDGFEEKYREDRKKGFLSG